MSHDTDTKPFDVTLSIGDKPLARFMRALIKHGVRISDSFTTNGGNLAYLRVFIRPEVVEAFRTDAKPVELREPPQVDIGFLPVDDEVTP